MATASIHCITNTCLESQPFARLYGTQAKQYGNVCELRLRHRKTRTGYVQQTYFMREPISLNCLGAVDGKTHKDVQA